MNEQQEQDGSLLISKKKKDVKAIFNQIHREVNDKGGFEAVGLFSEEDVVEMIREQRNAKNNI